MADRKNKEFDLITKEQELRMQELAAKGNPYRTEELQKAADQFRAKRKEKLAEAGRSPTQTGWDTDNPNKK